MTYTNKIRYFQQALLLGGLSIDAKTSDLILLTHEVFLEKGSRFTLKDSAKIQAEISERYSAPGEDKFREVIQEASNATQLFTLDEPLEEESDPEDSLGAWLKRGSTRAILQQLNESYGAGTPLRLVTVLLKNANEEILRKRLSDIKEKDLTSIPRVGKAMWKAFIEAKNFKLTEVPE